MVEPVPDLDTEGDPLTVYVPFELIEDDPDTLAELVELADTDDETRADPE